MAKDSKVINFLKGSAILVFANLIIKAINFFLLPLYTSYLSPKDLGVSDTITTLTGFILPLLVMGFDSAFSAFYFDEKDENHIIKVFNTVEFTMIRNSIIPTVLCFFSKDISVLLFKTNEYYALICVALISVAINMVFLPFSLHIRMKNRMTIYAIINITASFSMIILNIVFVSILKLGAAALIYSSGIVCVLQLVLYAVFAKIKIDKSYYNKQLKSQMVKYALPLIPSIVAAWILNLSDRYIILFICGEGDVGIYGIAARFSTMIAVVSNAIYMSYTSFAFEKKDDDNANQQYARILGGFFLLLLGICFTISIFGKEVINLMTSKSYLSVYLMIPGILYGQVAYGVNTIVGYGVSFAKKTKYSLFATAAGAATNIILNFIFIPKYGAVAAAYTTFFGYALMAIMIYYFSQKVYPCDYKILRILIATVVSFLVLLLTMDNDFYLKIFVWIVVAGGISFAFRDVLKDYIKILKMIIKR